MALTKAKEALTSRKRKSALAEVDAKEQPDSDLFGAEVREAVASTNPLFYFQLSFRRRH